ncbi:universal stress protein [Candidatus Sumerlaeota bacterium]|nr:universal stress protein [Candidatus Sumerlaeota bacterium]
MSISRLGVFLNGSPADPTVLAYARATARFVDPGGLRFFHFREKGIADPHPDPSQDAFEALVREEMGDALPGDATFEVLPDRGSKAILRSIHAQDLTTVMVGRRLPTAQMAVAGTFKKLAARAPSNVFVVTKYSQPHLERILIPVDFTEHSAIGIHIALDLLRMIERPNVQILFQHNVEVEYGYRYAGVSFEEYARTLEANAMEEMERFLKPFDLSGIQTERVITISDRPSEAVTALAVARKMDIVVVGSRSKSSPLGVFLGSTAENILLHCPLPVLIAKTAEDARRLREEMPVD